MEELKRMIMDYTILSDGEISEIAEAYESLPYEPILTVDDGGNWKVKGKPVGFVPLRLQEFTNDFAGTYFCLQPGQHIHVVWKADDGQMFKCCFFGIEPDDNDDFDEGLNRAIDQVVDGLPCITYLRIAEA